MCFLTHRSQHLHSRECRVAYAACVCADAWDMRRLCVGKNQPAENASSFPLHTWSSGCLHTHSMERLELFPKAYTSSLQQRKEILPFQTKKRWNLVHGDPMRTSQKSNQPAAAFKAPDTKQPATHCLRTDLTLVKSQKSMQCPFWSDDAPGFRRLG